MVVAFDFGYVRPVLLRVWVWVWWGWGWVRVLVWMAVDLFWDFFRQGGFVGVIVFIWEVWRIWLGFRCSFICFLDEVSDF